MPVPAELTLIQVKTHVPGKVIFGKFSLATEFEWKSQIASNIRSYLINLDNWALHVHDLTSNIPF